MQMLRFFRKNFEPLAMPEELTEAVEKAFKETGCTVTSIEAQFQEKTVEFNVDLTLPLLPDLRSAALLLNQWCEILSSLLKSDDQVSGSSPVRIKDLPSEGEGGTKATLYCAGCNKEKFLALQDNIARWSDYVVEVPSVNEAPPQNGPHQ